MFLKLLEKIGVKFETVKSGLFKDILSPDRALTSEERDLLQSLIDSSYNQFVKIVAEGRKLSEGIFMGISIYTSWKSLFVSIISYGWCANVGVNITTDTNTRRLEAVNNWNFIKKNFLTYILIWLIISM